MRIELTVEQLEALKQIVNRTQVSGQDAEFVVGLKNVLANAKVEDAPPKE